MRDDYQFNCYTTLDMEPCVSRLVARSKLGSPAKEPIAPCLFLAIIYSISKGSQTSRLRHYDSAALHPPLIFKRLLESYESAKSI